MTKPHMALVERILRYGIAGCLIAITCSVLTIVLIETVPAMGPVGNTVLAFCLIQPIGYMTHRKITYPDAHLENAEILQSKLRFLLTNILGFIITVGTMAIVTHVYHASYLWAIALTWIFIPTMNFLIYLIWVFRVRPRR